MELAALTDPALVVQAVATALGVREQPGQPLTETLSSQLRARRLLLLLDNCEHLSAACAHMSERLLQRCPHLRMLVTSREALGLARRDDLARTAARGARYAPAGVARSDGPGGGGASLRGARVGGTADLPLDGAERAGGRADLSAAGRNPAGDRAGGDAGEAL